MKSNNLLTFPHLCNYQRNIKISRTQICPTPWKPNGKSWSRWVLYFPLQWSQLWASEGKQDIYQHVKILDAVHSKNIVNVGLCTCMLHTAFTFASYLQAKYCQGSYVIPKSVDRSSTHRSGRGEFANFIRT